MNIGIIVAIIILNRLDHSQRLLRCGRVVQVDQRLAVHGLMQDGKVLADLLHVICGNGVDSMRYFCDCAHPTSPQFRSAPSADRAPEYLAASGSPATTSFSR